jgi:hypothetical protein
MGFYCKELSMVSNIQSSTTATQTGFMRAHRSLTDDQKKTVQDILSNYDSSKITAADAKSIFKSLEEAGIKGGGLRDAINAAGFDADQVWSLAHDGQKPPQGGPGGPGGKSASSSSTQVNSSALQALQTILNQYDLSNMTDEKQKDLMSKLNDSGLLQSGSMINLGA